MFSCAIRVAVTILAVCLIKNSYANCIQEEKIKQGVNYLSLINHDKKDLAILSFFDNNTSHPNRGLSFYIKNNNGYSIIPVPNSDMFIWFDYSLSASRINIFDYRLYYHPKGKKLISVQKQGDDLTAMQPIKITVYKLVESHDDPGVPPYSWVIENTLITNEKYGSAYEVLDDIRYLCSVL
ncbi:carbapenem self-resistance protein CarG family protein [Dickeya dianthicola]|uniref:carbapenem self-resistance protein CarG family protein n=1 Tax=Dickeya dianthicola TaxID=204039 RepID=UPI001865C11E|nr:CpmJ protein [Dickeya dianthicola]QOL16276.1 CpmJ protein [Dickeya dianthicola]